MNRTDEEAKSEYFLQQIKGIARVNLVICWLNDVFIPF